MRAVNPRSEAELATQVVKADTFWTRLRGLTGRTGLESGEALWIVPCRSIHTHGMAFPIDVVFLDRDRNVVGLEENLSPGRFAPIRWKARTVLELPAGTVRRSRTRIGDRIEIEPKEA
ncbi:MAG TPA: DUF192 domain-containing protein [Candidatus Polarisedimenticolia bacterium]|nr:DUF192 domain-containing protein [Candidatus Polarisedimenticolia bacterium]